MLLVITCHLGGMRFGPFVQSGATGSVGVDVFFTLSGFLITSLLVQEYRRTGAVSLRVFYSRRARRILPALGAVVMGWWLFGLAAGLPTIPHPWPVLLFAGNWEAVRHTSLGHLSPTWSLAIEEQFYLVWPVVLTALLRRRLSTRLVVLVAVIVASAGLRTLLFFTDGSSRAQFGSDTRAGALFVGALLAVLAQEGLLPVPRVKGLRTLVTVVALAQFVWVLPNAPVVRAVVTPTVVPLLTAALIWAVCTGADALTWRWLRYVGRRSYAIYLWHFGVLWTVMILVGHSLLAGAIGVGISIALAEASWRLVESPLLKRQRVEPTLHPAPPTAGTSPHAARWRHRPSTLTIPRTVVLTRASRALLGRRLAS